MIEKQLLFKLAKSDQKP